MGATTGAIFRVVLNGTQDFTESFWNTNREWSDIFKTSDGGSALSIASIFSGTVQYYNGGGGTLASVSDPTAEGYFTISGTSLNWTAVPEPTSALAGLLSPPVFSAAAESEDISERLAPVALIFLFNSKSKIHHSTSFFKPFLPLEGGNPGRDPLLGFRIRPIPPIIRSY